MVPPPPPPRFDESHPSWPRDAIAPVPFTGPAPVPSVLPPGEGRVSAGSPGDWRMVPSPPPPRFDEAHPSWPRDAIAPVPFTGPVPVTGTGSMPIPATGPRYPFASQATHVDPAPMTGPVPTAGLAPSLGPARSDTGPGVVVPSSSLPVPAERTGPLAAGAGTGPRPAMGTGPLDVTPLARLGGSAVGRQAGRPAFQPNLRRRPGGPRRRSEPAVVSVDNNRCHLYAICQQEAPSSFLLADDHRLYYDASPPSHQMASVRQAARLCPMQAITLENGAR
ncbi:ferredoxin [Pseudofrankia sp. BMG5.37]|uniref:ferredoxin n=1 Tax=Pseudofrankia sp. BMG5.37 TaxID=3050035 RepID=UPI0028956D9C|nr:ferredoxin [Pseudofrankia sp. BMG5.37]MDT3440377.1 ferredoxin [Pseudofrankia sp. BMG5.37]